MQTIKNYYLDSTQKINPKSLKSGCLSRLFKLKSNTILATKNKFNSHNLMIIIETKCTKSELLLISQLLLTTIKLNYHELITIKNHQLYLGSHPISTSHHHHSAQSGIICHSISLRPNKSGFSVAHLDTSVKDFSIEILNTFSNQLNLIINHELHKK